MKLNRALLIAAINTSVLSLALDLEAEIGAELEAIRHRLCINPDTITMSGLSGGGFFAHKMHVVHSETVKGVGIMQGGPMIPGFDNEEEAEYYKHAEPEELAQLTVADINANSNAGLIDDVSNLVGSAAYIFSGTKDTVVPPNLQEAIELTYLELGLNPDKIVLEYANQGHGLKKYLPAEIVKWLFLELGIENELNEQVDNPEEYGRQVKVKQKRIAKYIGSTLEETQMQRTGKIYIPDTCNSGQKCHVHFVLHGNGGGNFESNERTLYNNLAARNNIIMVYPKFNAGYADTLIADASNNTKDGIFPRVIMAMIDILKNGGSCPE